MHQAKNKKKLFLLPLLAVFLFYLCVYCLLFIFLFFLYLFIYLFSETGRS